jgi:predicted nucleotidyltransferase
MVAAILRQYAGDRSVFAFGSRATGKRLKQYSDLDLAFLGRLDPATHANLVDAFDESLLPFKVDIIELDLVEPAFRARIESDLIPLTPIFA